MQFEKIWTEDEIITKYENLLEMPNALKEFFEKSEITLLLLGLQTKQIIIDPKKLDEQLHNALKKTNSPIHSKSCANSLHGSICRNVKDGLIKFFQSSQ